MLLDQPKTPLSLLLFLFRGKRSHKRPGCPIHRALCDGWDECCQASHNAVVVACPPTLKRQPSFSTEAAHNFIVSSTAEKSASPPQPLLQQHAALLLLIQITR